LRSERRKPPGRHTKVIFRTGKITTGIAAQIAGVDRLTFLASLARYGVAAINLRDEEVELEIEAAGRLAGS